MHIPGVGRHGRKLSDRKLLAGLLVFAVCPSPASATLPHDRRCFDGVCYDTLYNADVHDTTYHIDASGRRYFVLRYNDGSELGFLLRPISQEACGDPAEAAYARPLVLTESRVALRGCVANPEAKQFFQVDVSLTHPSGPIRSQLRNLGASVYLHDIPLAGNWSGRKYDSGVLLLDLQPGTRPPVPSAPMAGSHCAASEQAYFSCTVKNSSKVISVCGSRDESPGGSYLQYRFGPPGKVEFEYPSNRRGSAKLFGWDSRAHVDVADDWLWFKDGGLVYGVFVIEDHDTGDGAPEYRAGLEVEVKNGPDEDGRTLQCAARPSGDFKRLGDFVEWKEMDD
jgi:hypothetical protein